jgi:hypothetical protein
LVAALVVSGGSGAGAQPGPVAPVPASASASAGGTEAAPAAESTVGTSKGEQGVRATAEKSKKKVKIPERGSGRFLRADVDGPKVGESGARLLRYAVKVEKGLPYDPDETARAIQATLSDSRSWIGEGDWRLELVSDPARASFTVFLATPGTVDRYCWPLRTYGRVSCQAGNRVMLNAWRWANGADAYGSDVGAYRQYLVNHEVGHRLGHRHVGCPGRGKRAPVMMQQTKGVGSCEANPWPAPERRG